MTNYDYTTGAASKETPLGVHADPKATRIRWMLGLPDLSRRAGSPVYHLVRRALSAPCLAGADEVTFPEVVSVARNFDVLNAPSDHPSRRSSDTYYIDAEYVLRTQTTCMWSWYLTDDRVVRRLRENGEVTGVGYGKVFRNDEIDRAHYPVFHQIDAVCIALRRRKVFEQRDLDEVLRQMARVIYGDAVETRILDDSFPFTERSRQLEIRWRGEWLELVGAGLVHPKCLENLGLGSRRFNGWAFGFGLDRLAMRKMEIPDIRLLWSTDERVTRQFDSIDSTFTPVSKYPATRRDISFVLDGSRSLNDFYEIVREHGTRDGEAIVEQVEHLDRYENPEKLGAGRVSHTFRILYRSFVRTLTNEEINDMQTAIREAVAAELGAQLR